MALHSKTIILLFTVIFALFWADVTYEIYHMNDEAPRMSNATVKQIVTDALHPEESADPYSRVAINVYTGKNGTVDYFVVYMSRADIYLVVCYRLEIEGSDVAAIIEDYFEEENDTDKCYACPDPDVEALFSTSITEVPTAEEAILYAANITTGEGLKTKTLLYAEQTDVNVKNYLSCPKLKIWGFVGHGNNMLVQVYASKTINYSYFNGLDSDALNGVTFVLNSCDVHKAPLEGSIFAAGVYFYGGGDETINAGDSENIMMAFIRKAVKEEMEMMQAGVEAEQEADYYEYGWSGDGSGPPYYFNNVITFYLNVTSPKGGEEWDQGKSYTTTWESNVDGNVKIDLLKGSSEIETLAASTDNDGEETITIPNALEKGDDYKIQISSIDNDTVINESEEFSISEATGNSEFPYGENLTFDLRYGNSKIWYQIPEQTKNDVSLKLYSTQGKLVRTLVNGPQNAGFHSIAINTHNEGKELAAGLYMCLMRTKGFSKTINILMRK